MYYIDNNSGKFIVLDTFILGFILLLKGVNAMYSLYIVAIVITISIISGVYENIIIRGYYKEFKSSFLFSVNSILTLVFLDRYIAGFSMENISILYLFIVLLFGTYCLRLLLKLKVKRTIHSRQKNVIVISKVEDIALFELLENEKIVAIMSKDETQAYKDIPIYENLYDVDKILVDTPIDEVYINFNSGFDRGDIINFINVSGMLTHINCKPIANQLDGKHIFHKIRDVEYLTASIHSISIYQIMFKRLLDILIAIIGCVVMAITALIIYPIVQSQSKGSLFFTQERIGQKGKRFTMYKFRTMQMNAEELKESLLDKNEMSTNHMFKIANDPRVFPLGKFLRKWSLDELPQFINVLKGEMSVVGTRPPTSDEWKRYKTHHFKRVFFKPGITGLWQVSGRGKIVEFEEVCKLDFQYMNNWRLIDDFKIILKTIYVVFKRDGSV